MVQAHEENVVKFMNRVLVIMPAYNEAASIEGVISAVKKELPDADILVVNDGSTDATSQIARGLGVMVADLPYNMGIGAAMQAGYRYAAMHSYDIAVQVDADGQHPPDQINNLVAPVMEQKADIVIGSRFLGEGEYYPKESWYENLCICGICNDWPEDN